MKVSRRDVLVTGLGIAPITGLWAAAVAQEARVGGVAAGLMTDDPLLAACLLIEGRKQIEKSRFGLERSENPDVKAFAEAEIREHETVRERLRQRAFQYPTPVGAGTGAAIGAGTASGAAAPIGAATAGGATGAGTTEAGRVTEIGRGPAGGAPGTPIAGTGLGTSPGVGSTGTGVAGVPGLAGPSGAGMGGRPGATAISVGRSTVPPPAADMILVDTEVAEQCIANARAELGRKRGSKFDKGFIGDQYHAHLGLLDHVQVFRRHASSELVPVLDEARPIIEQHIATLRDLMERLDRSKG